MHYEVFVEAGSFMMGSDDNEPEAYQSEKPKRKVTLTDDFYIGRYEVTQGLWKAVMGGQNPSINQKGDNYPVESVSWDDAQLFLNRLSALTGLEFTLPTEAQWEYAARGGKDATSYKYSGSDSVFKVAWIDDKQRAEKTLPVGQKEPNQLGIYDMSGNVYEWCQDWYGDDTYTSSAVVNPVGPDSGDMRVLRGGSWERGREYARVAFRGSIQPVTRYYAFGFRIVMKAK